MDLVINNTDQDTRDHAMAMSFPDKSDSFQNGFEAGSIWMMLKLHSLNLGTLESPLKLHEENRQVLEIMAAREGYSVEFSPHEVSKFVNVAFTLGRPSANLSVVRGEQ